MKRRVLVTGGLGFIGSHLVDRLLEEGSDVVVVDNLSSNVVEPRDYSSSCRVVSKSIRNWNPRGRFDDIYHLASPVGPVGVLQYAGRLGYEIVADTQVVASWAMRMEARLLFTSTSEVYGRSGVFAEDEVKHVPPKVSVRLSYGLGKLLSEIDLFALASQQYLWVTIMRPFNIAGPRQSSKGGFVLPRFIEQALTDKPITVYGDGSQVRSFTHVVDLVAAMMMLLRSSKAKGEIFNVGNPDNKMRIGELAKLVKQLTDSRSPIRFVDPRRLHGKRFAEAFDKVPDMTKMRRMFGWSPAKDIDEIIADSLEYYRQRVGER